MSVIAKIKEFIIEHFLFGDGANLQDDTQFIENGIIDSTGILELATYIEKNFNLKINDDEFVPENLNSLNSISCFLDKKLVQKV